MAEQETQTQQKQKKKKLKKSTALLIILLAILAALLTTYALVRAYNAKLDEAKTGTGEVTEVLKFDIGDVESFSYLYGDNLVTLERDGDDWIYTDDKKMELDVDRVESMLSNISTLTTKQVVAEIIDADKMSSYGLKDPSFLVSVTFKDGTTKILTLGVENPMTQSTYASVDKESVFMVESTLASSFVSPEQLEKQDEGTASGSEKEDDEEESGEGEEE